MTDSNRSKGPDLFDQWHTHRGDEQQDDTAAPPTLPRRARAVPVDAPPVFERAVLEPLEADPSAGAGLSDVAAQASGTTLGEADYPPQPVVTAPVVTAPVVAEPVDAELTVAEPVVADPPARVTIAPTRPAPVHPAPLRPAAAPGPQTAAAKTEPEPIDEPVPHTVIFKPRRATRRALTSVLLVWIVASAASIAAAWKSPSQATIGIAAAIVILTLLTWVVRGGTSVARVTVRGGTLEIRKAGVRTNINLGDSYQLIEVVGKPGSMGWKVLFFRKDVEPYVVDASLVDPKEFMRVLTYYRPEFRR